ncbi:cbb3-type cytochrome c oxidase subunit I [Pollutimonas bauzanensis]|uniref:Cytochrome C and Quinol oxidase polypeptide I n=1 Tax=Pollutimonas bauzanensis TaxID=658167 RepID=A0A1M5Z5P5_9BURK|nr:cbb3-type cytochrome c oxidase subunit I [Pollutimonas bauzanensis]SHI19562.1 Cytochrome C and Quinol oxidase polypeptide I [Pollutimonas bauzanensis]
MNAHTVSTHDSMGRVTASTPARYALPATTAGSRRLARAWLRLALAALLGSGLFSVLLVLARTPGINAVLPGGDFFRVALVVHVDLSVLVWFVAVAGMLWSLNLRALTPGSRLAAQLAWALCAAGALGMAAAPFVDSGAAIMANYIPMIDSATFRIALLVFAAGGLLLVLQAMICAVPIGPAVDGTGALRFGLHASAVAAAVALLALGWSLAVMPAGLPADAYYEILYWGGGHALQFTWTLLMLVSWLVLVQACGGQVPLSPRIVLLLFALALAGVFVTPLAYLMYDISSVEHRHMHTWAMRLGGGMAIAPLMLAVLLGLAPLRRLAPGLRPLRAAVLASLLLFVAGGLIGLTIAGSNVRIPAHYHGSIVGVTLALMGMIYWLLPRLGYAAPSGRTALLQPWLYGGGQLLHIVGLMWSGGYGVQRKVAGAQQVLRTSGEIAGMGLMGLGGLLAIGGGLLFALVVIRAMRGVAATPAKQRDGAA